MGKNKKSDVTAIIPVYNGEKYLKEAIESVLNQTVLPDELVIIDDGSIDGSLDIIKQIKCSIPIKIISQQNAGQSSARNNGVKNSKTNYIAFLDQDDFWYKNHIEVLIQPFLQNPSIGWVYSNLDTVRSDGSIIQQNLLDTINIRHPKNDINICLSEDMFILPSASIIRKKAFQSINGFDERLSGYEDDDLFLRLFYNGWKNIYINDSLSAWRIHLASSMFSKRMLTSRRIYWEKLINNYPDKPEVNQFYVRDRIAPRFFKYALNEYIRGIKSNDYDLCAESYTDMMRYSLKFNTSFLMKFKLIILKYIKITRIFKPAIMIFGFRNKLLSK